MNEPIMLIPKIIELLYHKGVITEQEKNILLIICKRTTHLQTQQKQLMRYAMKAKVIGRENS